MASRTSLKKNKRTKHGRTRRQRHRRRQMRGGDFLDIFKPTVKDAAYCQKQFDECKANIKPDSDSAADADSGSSDFFKTPTFISNLFESKDSTGSVEEEKENEGIEMQEYPGSEQAAAPVEAPVSYAAPAVAKPVSDADAAAAAAASASAAAAASPLSPPPPAESTLDSTSIDAAKLSPLPAPAEYGLTAQPTAESEETEETEAEKAARINNSMGVVGVVSGGGSRKKYKKRNANRSKKNKNRRNNKRTNKRN
jgi:hypothetical protein